MQDILVLGLEGGKILDNPLLLQCVHEPWGRVGCITSKSLLGPV